MTELILVGVIALILIGPKELPEVAKVVARFIGELKRATSELTETVTKAVDMPSQQDFFRADEPPTTLPKAAALPESNSTTEELHQAQLRPQTQVGQQVEASQQNQTDLDPQAAVGKTKAKDT